MATTPHAVEQAEAEAVQAASERLGLYVVSAVLALTALAFAIYPALALRWRQQPFLGAFIEHTLVFSDSPPTREGSWSARAAGIGFGDQLLALDQDSITSTSDLNGWLRPAAVDQDVLLTYARRGEPPAQVTVRLDEFPAIDLNVYFVIPYLIGLVYIGIGAWVFYLRRDQAAGRVFAVFAASIGLLLAGLFDLGTTHQLTRLWTLALGLAPGALLALAAIFPHPPRGLERWRLLVWLAIGTGLALGLLGQVRLMDRADPLAYVSWWRAQYLFAALSFVLFLGAMIYRRRTSGSPVVREQVRMILLGAAVAFTPIVLWFVVTLIAPVIQFQPLWLLPTTFAFPLAIAYAILRYRWLDLDNLISRGAVYAALMLLTALSYILLVVGAGLLVGAGIGPAHPLLIGTLVFLLAIAFQPVRSWLQGHVEQRFFRGRRAYADRLQHFSRELTEAIDLPNITTRLRAHVEQALRPTHLHIFIYDAVQQGYAAVGSGRGPTTDLRFSAAGGLAQQLRESRAALYLAPDDPFPLALLRDRPRLAVLGSVLFVPLNTQERLAGWLALGPARSGDPYAREDLEFLEALTDQSSLAIARAQVVVDLERRVNELNVLGRVAQAVNFTQSYDDLLELIYAQTNHVLPIQDFRIALFDERSETLNYAFLLQGDERVFRREGERLRPDQGLLPHVARSGAPLRVEDYTSECITRRMQLDETFKAWMGVPLNAGTSTLGAIGVGGADPSVTYSDEQLQILASIADQAAGAIVKARLYREAEERARQLATLNRIASSLATTLEVDPLLQRILTGGVELLECEAGSLVLVDEDTGELIFQVTSGPLATDLAGRRLPPGSGIVGACVEQAELIVINDATSDPRWLNSSEQHPGFEVRSVMAVPLMIKDRVIGVIEVLNKRGQNSFDDDDQILLAAFAAQAAVAIENARLYTLTDQALASRVEELSVMQRIDRELNVTLDARRAMTITLTWALRYMDADAGLMVMEEEEENKVVFSQGYPSGFEPNLDQAAPPSLGGLQQVVRTGRPMRVQDITGDVPWRGLHPGCRSFVAIPLKRENQVIGAMLLESVRSGFFTDERVEFLTRLSDHASIAISNAQLYAEVQDANLAKSDFVSFVSHELKTPMTSIKGYADLLAQGTVGPITESQSNFLNTIRSNVERMSTLVTDLTDISRIESGRIRLEFEAVPFDSIVEEVVRSIQELIDAKQQELAVELGAKLPPAWGDRTRMIQVLTNLVSNANKYTPEGGKITLSVAYMSEDPVLAGSPEVLHISVKDTGIGISEDEKAQIFTKFFRSENRTVRETPGTGLGLSISKYLVGLQGGRIWFESRVGEGSTFHFTLPVSEEGGTSTQAVAPAAAEEAPATD